MDNYKAATTVISPMVKSEDVPDIIDKVRERYKEIHGGSIDPDIVVVALPFGAGHDYEEMLKKLAA